MGPGDVARRWGSQEKRQPLYLLGSTNAVNRAASFEALLEVGRRELGQERARQNCVDQNVVAGELKCGLLGEVRHTRLRYLIGHTDDSTWPDARNRRGQDDASTVLSLHMRNSGSNGRKDRGQIRIDDLVPQPVRDGLDRTLRIPFAGHRQKSRSGVDARIGENDIETAVSFDRFVDSGPDCIAIGNIDGDAGYIAARLELGHRLIEA